MHFSVRECREKKCRSKGDPGWVSECVFYRCLICHAPSDLGASRCDVCIGGGGGGHGKADIVREVVQILKYTVTLIHMQTRGGGCHKARKFCHKCHKWKLPCELQLESGAAIKPAITRRESTSRRRSAIANRSCEDSSPSSTSSAVVGTLREPAFRRKGRNLFVCLITGRPECRVVAVWRRSEETKSSSPIFLCVGFSHWPGNRF